MNWIKYDKDVDGEMPEMNLNDPGTEIVWICTDNRYADRYGVGSYEYSEDGGGWSYYGCTKGFNVTHWAKIEPPVQKMDKTAEHRWYDTGGQLMLWPPIKVYKCSACGMIGNLHGHRMHDSHEVRYDMSEMACENKVCDPTSKSTTESI